MTTPNMEDAMSRYMLINRNDGLYAVVTDEKVRFTSREGDATKFPRLAEARAAVGRWAELATKEGGWMRLAPIECRRQEIPPEILSVVRHYEAAVDEVLDMADETRRVVRTLQAAGERAGRMNPALQIGHGSGTMPGILILLQDAVHVDEVESFVSLLTEAGWEETHEPITEAEYLRRTWVLGTVKVLAFFPKAEDVEAAELDRPSCRFAPRDDGALALFRYAVDGSKLGEVETASIADPERS